MSFQPATLFPERASSMAGEVDAIALTLLGLCAAVAGLVLALIVWFCIRYRRGSRASREGRQASPRKWEIVWTGIPLLLFTGIFGWAAEVYVRMSRSPDSAGEIHVVGKQWMWKIQHRDGRREINEMHLPVNRPVKLVMISEDVIHDFFVPAFRVKQDVLPGRYTSLWFTPTRPGRYHLFCAQYCGMDHAMMGGWVYVMEPGDYRQWLDRENAPLSLAGQGGRLFRSLGCSGCHSETSKVPAPPLAGLYGKPVRRQDGIAAVAGDSYLRDAILLPNKSPLPGYAPVMPAYQGRITEEELNAVIAYLKSPGFMEGRTP